MTYYKHLVLQNNALRKRLVDFSGIDEGLIQNFIHFTQCLVRPETGMIETQMFQAVMARYFSMTDVDHVERLFYSMSTKETRDQGGMSVEEFCRILCVFFTEDLAMKTDSVFQIYDVDNDGHLDMHEISIFLRECRCVSDREPFEFQETFNDLSVMVSDVLGVTDRRVTREMFRDKVLQNPMVLSILGHIVPTTEDGNKFLAVIQGKSYRQMRDAFGRIRLELLYELPTPDEFDKYYPITLDFP